MTSEELVTDSSLPPRFGAWRFDTAPPETDLPSESGAWLLGEGRPNPALVLDLAEVIPENFLPQAIQIAGWAQNPIVRLYGLERLIDRCQNASHETLERVLAAVLTLKQDAWRAAMVGELAPWLVDAGLGAEDAGQPMGHRKRRACGRRRWAGLQEPWRAQTTAIYWARRWPSPPESRRDRPGRGH